MSFLKRLFGGESASPATPAAPVEKDVEHRRHVRVLVNLEMLAVRDGHGTEMVTVFNVSLSGLMFDAKEPPKVGEPFRGLVQRHERKNVGIKIDEDPISMNLRVCWVQRSMFDRTRFHVGCAYLEAESLDRDKWVKHQLNTHGITHGIERRKHYRLRTNNPLVFKTAKGVGKGSMRDLSKTGLRALIHVELPPGTELLVGLPSKDNGPIVEQLPAKVVWCVRRKDLHEVGLAFRPLEPEARDQLIRMLEHWASMEDKKV